MSVSHNYLTLAYIYLVLQRMTWKT